MEDQIENLDFTILPEQVKYDSTKRDLEIHSFQVLVKAAEGYLKGIDELAQICVQPELKKAVAVIDALLVERYNLPTAPDVT